MAEYKVPNINRILITGNLTTEPDLRYTPDGKAVCNFQIASNYRYLDKNKNEWIESPTFVRVVVFGDQGERIGGKLKRGSAVFVEGRLQSRKWETPDGQRHSDIEIIAIRVQNLTKSTEEKGAEEESGTLKDDLPF